MGKKKEHKPKHMRRQSRMDIVRSWWRSAPIDVITWMLGSLLSDLLTKLLDQEIARLANMLRDLIGL